MDQKLYKIAMDVSKAGIWFAVFTLLAILFRFYIDVKEGKEHMASGPVNEKQLTETYKVIMDYMVVAFAIILVAVPEGLVLAVIIAAGA